MTKAPCVAPSAEDISALLPLVHRVVAGFMTRLPANVLRDDLVAAGTFGLIDSLRKNGHNRGPGFEWYARARIRGAVLDELRTEDWLSRRGRAQATAELPAGRSAMVGLDDLPVAVSQLKATGGTPLELTIESSEREALTLAVEALPERERTIVSKYYFKGEQFKTIAEELGVSEPRISQLHARAVAMLRQTMCERGHEAA